MMRTPPTWLSLLTVGALALTACGGDDGAETEPTPGAETGGGDSTGDGATDATGDGATDGTAEDDGQAAGECQLDEAVPVGVVLSQTGGAAVYGSTQANGVQLAADQLNERGSGVTYELVIEDDASTPEEGIPAFEKLINRDNVSAIIGPTLSNTAFSTDPVAQENQVPVLGVSNTAEGITDLGDYVFRNSLTEGQVIPQTIAAATEQFDLSKVAVLYGDDDAFTESGYQVFQEAIDEQGLEVTTTQTFAKGDTDFSAQLTEAKQSDPDALVVSALAEEGALIIGQARDLGLDVPVIGGNGFNSPAIIENAGEDAEDTIVGAAWNSASDTPNNQEFISAFEEAYGSAPDQFAAQAYAGMNILAAAVEDACSADPTEIRDALAGLEPIDTVLGEFTFTENRDADHPAVVQIIQDGEFTILE
jgi:branched-chain amino acid transport system substrate-binding protein